MRRRLTEEAYVFMLRSAKDANYNTLRVWGGGLYYHDIVYDTADEMGLLMYHDAMYGQVRASSHHSRSHKKHARVRTRTHAHRSSSQYRESYTNPRKLMMVVCSLGLAATLGLPLITRCRKPSCATSCAASPRTPACSFGTRATSAVARAPGGALCRRQWQTRTHPAQSGR